MYFSYRCLVVTTLKPLDQIKVKIKISFYLLILHHVVAYRLENTRNVKNEN